MAMVLTFVYRRLSRSQKSHQPAHCEKDTVLLEGGLRSVHSQHEEASAMHTRTQDHLQRQLLHQQAVIARAARCFLSQPYGGLKSWGVCLEALSGFRRPSAPFPASKRTPFIAEGPPPALLLRPPLWRREFSDQGRRVRGFGIGEGKRKSWCLSACRLVGTDLRPRLLDLGLRAAEFASRRNEAWKTGVQVYGPGKPRVSKPLDFPVLGTELSCQNIQKRRKPQCQANYTHELRSAKQQKPGGDAGTFR